MDCEVSRADRQVPASVRARVDLLFQLLLLRVTGGDHLLIGGSTGVLESVSFRLQSIVVGSFEAWCDI